MLSVLFVRCHHERCHPLVVSSIGVGAGIEKQSNKAVTACASTRAGVKQQGLKVMVYALYLCFVGALPVGRNSHREGAQRSAVQFCLCDLKQIGLHRA